MERKSDDGTEKVRRRVLAALRVAEYVREYANMAAMQYFMVFSKDDYELLIQKDSM